MTCKTRDEAMCAAGVEPCPCAAATLLHAAEQDDKIAALRAFAQDVMLFWSDGVGIDGSDLERIATKHRLLEREIMHAPCSEDCFCVGYADNADFAAGVTCYRKTAMLTGR